MPVARPAMTAIPLGRELLHGSSFLPARSASHLNACLFGIAPDGGYRVSPFAMHALQRLVSVALFLALYLAAFSGRPLTVILLYGVRTFLPPTGNLSASDCLACFSQHCSPTSIPRPASCKTGCQPCGNRSYIWPLIWPLPHPAAPHSHPAPPDCPGGPAKS